MGRRLIIIAAVLVIIVLVVAGFIVFTNTQFTPSGGIEGTALVGPTCPVEQNPPQAGCADRPFVGELSIVQNDFEVGRFRTDSNGHFKVPLNSGNYTIQMPKGAPIMPTLAPVSVNVAEGQFSEVNLTLDSGIR